MAKGDNAFTEAPALLGICVSRLHHTVLSTLQKPAAFAIEVCVGLGVYTKNHAIGLPRLKSWPVRKIAMARIARSREAYPGLADLPRHLARLVRAPCDRATIDIVEDIGMLRIVPRAHTGIEHFRLIVEYVAVNGARLGRFDLGKGQRVGSHTPKRLRNMSPAVYARLNTLSVRSRMRGAERPPRANMK